VAIPRVFVSSTCYDLKYIRENLKYFIRTLGYDPVLSEEGSVYYDPTLDTQDSCLREVPSCQLFLLIIGGRFGETYKDTETSITNIEYREAVKSKVPIFALVDNSVLSEYFVYQKNKANPEIDENKIDYPSLDSTKIFDFIEEVRRNSVNNALVPFSDFSDIEAYLRQQWAGMMFSFLTRQNEDRRVADTLSALTQISEKVEFLSTQILKSIGTEEAKLMSELYDIMMGFQCFRDLAWFKLKPTPKDILRNETFEGCAASLGKKLEVLSGVDFTLSGGGGGTIESNRFKSDSEEYLKLRGEMLKILSNYNISLKDFLNR
jgi:hypothetical protein